MYTSIRAILNTIPIPPEHYEEASVLEWAYEAVSKLGISQQLENKVCTIEVQNHKALLPPGTTGVMCVVLRRNTVVSEDDLRELCSLLTQEEQERLGCNSTDPASLQRYNTLSHYFGNVAIGGYNDYELSRIQRQGIINNYNVFVGTRLYENHFLKVHPTRNQFALQNCPDCPQVCKDCPNTYSITPHNEIVTSFESGTICIWYTGMPFNTDGDLIIPEDAEYQGALINWVMSRYWEYKMTLHEQNAMNMHAFYLRKAEITIAKARGKFQLKKVDYKSLRRIMDEYSNFSKQATVWNRVPGIAINNL